MKTSLLKHHNKFTFTYKFVWILTKNPISRHPHQSVFLFNQKSLILVEQQQLVQQQPLNYNFDNLSFS